MNIERAGTNVFPQSQTSCAAGTRPNPSHANRLIVYLRLIVIFSILLAQSNARDQQSPRVIRKGVADDNVAPVQELASAEATQTADSQEPASPTLASRPPVSLSARGEFSYDLAKLRQGHRIDYLVKVEWQGPLSDVTINTPTAPSLDGLDLVGTRSGMSLDPESNKAQHVFTYELRASKEGSGRVGLTIVKYTIRGSGESAGPLTLEVPAHDVTILPPEKNYAKTFTIITLGAIAAIALIMGLSTAFRGRKAPLEPTVPEPGPLDQLKERIETLKSIAVTGEVQQVYEQAHRILRDYLGLRMNGDFQNSTTPVLIAAVADNGKFDPRQGMRLRGLLEGCDDVRYGGLKPDAREMSELILELERLVKEDPLKPKEEEAVGNES